jgi:transposase InsO family protein
MLQVSRAGYYAFLTSPPSERQQRQMMLKQRIHRVHMEHRGRYGAPRIVKELQEQGLACCRNTVAKLMQEEGICGISPRSFVPRTTDSNHEHPTAPNLLQRDFTARRPNQKWVADITYVPTAEGWLYLAAVKDLCTRKIVGWSMSQSMAADLVCDALRMAVRRECPGEDLIHHSDRGSQYAGSDFRELLQRAGIECSMSRRGDCYDNAAMESFWGTYKQEEVYLSDYKHMTRQQVRLATFIYIETYYNRRRRHSALGYQSPEQYHQSLTRRPAA